MTKNKTQFGSSGAESRLSSVNKVIDHIEAALDALRMDPQRTAFLLGTALHEARALSETLTNDEPEHHKMHCSLFESVELAFTQTKHLADPKQLSLIHDIEPNEHTVYTDPHKLKQVLVGLIQKSIRTTNAGYIKISAMKNRSYMHISVIDTGAVKADNAEAEWSDLLDKQKTAKSDDSYSIRQWVKAQGGDIWFSQNYDGGSILSFTLPVEEASVPEAPVEPEQTNHKILVVDDDPINRMVLQGILRNQYDINEACDGLEAIKTTLDWRPNLVLMDVMMPRMSGYDACEEIRKTYDKDKLPILFITAKRPEDETSELERSGGSAILTKPIDKDALLSTIQQYISHA